MVAVFANMLYKCGPNSPERLARTSGGLQIVMQGTCARDSITENYYRKTLICLTAILLFVYSIKTVINYFNILTYNCNSAFQLIISLCLVAVWQLVLHEYEWMNECIETAAFTSYCCCYYYHHHRHHHHKRCIWQTLCVLTLQLHVEWWDM